MLSVGVKSDKGKVRQRNEDSYCARDNLFAVADGLGGHLAGEVASKLAIDELVRGIEENPLPGLEEFEKIFHQANRQICQLAEANPQYHGMGTTLTAIQILEDRVLLGHVGDSRAYLYRGGELCQLTVDHSLSGELYRKGELSEQEAEHHPQKHVLTRALGTFQEVDVDTSSFRLGVGDLLLLCTDGLHGKVSGEELSAILAERDDPQITAERLVEAALAKGGQDNITVIVIKNDEDELVDYEFSLELDEILEKFQTPIGVS
jgi:protein phosphatase